MDKKNVSRLKQGRYFIPSPAISRTKRFLEPSGFMNKKGLALAAAPLAVRGITSTLKGIYQANLPARLQGSGLSTNTKTGRDLMKIGDLQRLGTGGFKIR